MKNEHKIKFIKSCRGLSLDKKLFYKVFIVLPIILSLVMINANALGTEIVIASVFALAFLLVFDIVYLAKLIKATLLKHKLLLRTGILLNCVVPLFYVSCLNFYDAFGLKSFLLYYLFPFVILSFACMVCGFLMAFRKRENKANGLFALVCVALLGTSTLIGKGVNDLLAEKTSENTHFLIIAISMLLVGCFVFAVVFLDLLRYYYFIKLEKSGLVTEDILKPECNKK